MMKFFMFMGKFATVLVAYIIYRWTTDDYITDMFWRGYLAATFMIFFWRLLDDLVTTKVTNRA